MTKKESIMIKTRKHLKSIKYYITIGNVEYHWESGIDKIKIIREGIPYESIEIISQKANLPIKTILRFLTISKTTYRKKRKSGRLKTKDGETVLFILELLDFGIYVFDNEKEKFQRWLKKVNISLGGITPESLFDSITGIQEVRNCLKRIEFGNTA